MPYRESPIGVKWRTRVSRANSSKRAFAKPSDCSIPGRWAWRMATEPRGYANGTFCCIGAGDVSDPVVTGTDMVRRPFLRRHADVGLSKEPEGCRRC